MTMKTLNFQDYGSAAAPSLRPTTAWPKRRSEPISPPVNTPQPKAAVLPEGLFPVVMSTLQNSGEDQYRIQSHMDGYRAVNRSHDLDATFTNSGIQVHLHATYPVKAWEIALTRWGYGDALETVPKATLVARDNRVEYRRETLTEWYLNGPLGLEQGFTLTQPAPNRMPDEALVLELSFAEEGAGLTTEDGQSVLWSVMDDSPDLLYGHLYVNDAHGRELPIHIEVAEAEHGHIRRMRLVVDDRLAVYPIVIDPIIQQAEFTGMDSVIVDSFGGSVAISSDTIVAGARNKNSSKGEAYVFIRNGNVWSPQAILTANDAVNGDGFGISVAISSDTAVVGAAGKNSSQGAAYVFTRSGWAWTQQVELTANDVAAGDNFGMSVAIDGNTLVVGARSKNSSQGAAYVFTRSGNIWSQQAELVANDAVNNDNFGVSVAISLDTLVVGAYAKNSSKGAVYIFTRSGSVWSQQTKLTASDAVNNDIFGTSVSISSNTLAVGAPGKNLSTGAAYIFTLSNNIWSQQSELTASDATTNDQFGGSVAISLGTLVVGAWKNSSSKGAAYVFTRSGGIWSQTQQTKLIAGDAANNDTFGYSVSIGGNTYIIGAPGKSNSTGEVYIFAPNSDLVVTPNFVLASNAVVAYGIAAIPINAGQVVFADPTAGLQIKPAHAYNLTEANSVVGVALNTAGIGQPVAYAVSGDVTFNSVFTQGVTYLLSDINPGALIPDSLLTSGDIGCVVGIATSPTNLRIRLNSSGVQK